MAPNKPLIIFDTDMDTDCDDAGALAILLQYVKQGRADLLGILTDAPDRYAAAACEAFCRHYGVSVPIGAVHDAAYPTGEGTRFDRYRTHREKNLAPARRYTHLLAERVGKRDDEYPAAAQLYRRLLAGAEQGSVTIVCVGTLTAIDELLLTGPDEISPLSGVELVKQRVTRLVSMTNAAWPEVVANNFNYDMDPLASARVTSTCPVPIHASPDGTRVITGASLSDRLPATHPLRLSYETYMEGERRGRSSWDLLALYYVLEPESGCFTATPRGRLCYEQESRRTWWRDEQGRDDREVRLAIPPEEMAARLEELLVMGE